MIITACLTSSPHYNGGTNVINNFTAVMVTLSLKLTVFSEKCALTWNSMKYLHLVSLLHAANCVRFGFWHCMWLFCLCMKYLRNRWMDLRQIHSEDVFGPSLGRVWMSGQRSRWPRTKQALFSPLQACMQLMFRKTSLALVCEGFWTFINMFLYWLCCSLCATP